jgi:hypothetical protein
MIINRCTVFKRSKWTSNTTGPIHTGFIASERTFFSSPHFSITILGAGKYNDHLISHSKKLAMTSAVPLFLRAAVRIPVGTWPEAVFLLEVTRLWGCWCCPIHDGMPITPELKTVICYSRFTNGPKMKLEVPE